MIYISSVTLAVPKNPKLSIFVVSLALFRPIRILINCFFIIHFTMQAKNQNFEPQNQGTLEYFEKNEAINVILSRKQSALFRAESELNTSWIGTDQRWISRRLQHGKWHKFHNQILIVNRMCAKLGLKSLIKLSCKFMQHLSDELGRNCATLCAALTSQPWFA